MIHLYQPVALRRLLEAGKEPKSRDLLQNRGEKWGLGGSALCGIQGWLIPQNSPSGMRIQQQKKKGWKQGNESAVLESDRKCKAEDEGGEQKGPFLHFDNLVGFMSKVKLITWDKSLAEHCPGLCREWGEERAGRAHGGHWGTPRSWG